MRISAASLVAIACLPALLAGCADNSSPGSSQGGHAGVTAGGGGSGSAGGVSGSGGGGDAAGGTTGAGGGAGASATAGRGGPAGSTGSGAAGSSGGSAVAGSGGAVGSTGAGGSGAGGRGGSVGAGSGGRGGSAGSAGSGTAGSGQGGSSSSSKPTIYFLDVGGKVLTAADAETPTVKTLVASAGQGPDGLAVDLAAGYIYWTDMGNPSANDGSVMRSNLDGSNVVTIVPKAMTFTPKQLRLDKAGGKLYWSDREGMRVMRSKLDGSNIEVLVTTGTTDTDRMDLSRWCVGMALDLTGGYFYWTQKGPDNGGVGTIRRAHIEMPAGQNSTNRTDIEVLFSGLPEPIDLELDLDAGLIYWADRGDDTISRAPIEIPSGSTAANRKDRQILVHMVQEAISVAIDKPYGRMYYTGGNGQLGRANLDGTMDSELTGVGTLTGIVVVHLP